MRKTCYECENCIYTPMCDNTLCPISNGNFAEICGGFTPIQKPPKTVFETITTSLEALAPLLVWEDYDWCVFRSNIIEGEEFDTKEEAIAATVAKLKEMKDEK